MRKIIFAISLMMMCSLVACESEKEPAESRATEMVEEIKTVEEIETVEEVETVEKTEEVVTDSQPELPIPDEFIEFNKVGKTIRLDEKPVVKPEDVYGAMRDITAKDLVSEIKIGWNLGNTLDATGGENAWGNPITTKEMIDEVAKKGFNCIRIPVTWYQYAQGSPDYAIDEQWLQRVEQVVDYALSNDMYVILDMHHEENGWLTPDKEKEDALRYILVKFWTQIANHFEAYGDHLIFEAMNEPRTKGSANEWNGGTMQERDVVNMLDQAFVETVRSSGGNNEKRILLLSTYGGSNVDASISGISIPQGDDKIGVSIHAYAPYLFTFSSADDLVVWDTNQHRGSIESIFMRLEKKFIEKGVPVIVTEFGAERKVMSLEDNPMGYNDTEVEKWVREYVQSAKKYGIPCVWWDNGICTPGNGEAFGIFDRNELTWKRENVVDAMIEEAWKE